MSKIFVDCSHVQGDHLQFHLPFSIIVLGSLKTIKIQWLKFTLLRRTWIKTTTVYNSLLILFRMLTVNNTHNGPKLYKLHITGLLVKSRISSCQVKKDTISTLVACSSYHNTLLRWVPPEVSMRSTTGISSLSLAPRARNHRAFFITTRLLWRAPLSKLENT